jgi:ERCC4-related helicase
MTSQLQDVASWLGQAQSQVFERLYRADFAQDVDSPISFRYRYRLIHNVANLATTTLGVRYLARLPIEFFEHQVNVFIRILTEDNHRLILADEVGLGKTIETGLFLYWLRQYRPQAKVLVVAPKPLVRQWQNELQDKFDILLTEFTLSPTTSHTVVYPQQLAEETTWGRLSATAFDLIVVDEAHRLLGEKLVHQRLVQLSHKAQHCLVLSATPIKRDAIEYHTLLQILDPRIYCQISTERFRGIAQHQQTLLNFLVKWGQKLDDGDFKTPKFLKALADLEFFITEDAYLSHCDKQLKNAPKQEVQERYARDILSYLERIYRIEARVVRHRRRDLVHKVLAERRFQPIPYKAYPQENNVLANLQHAIRQYLQHYPDKVDYAQLLLGAFASSPEALQGIIRARFQFISGRVMPPLAPEIKDKLVALPVDSEERHYLESVLQATEAWQEYNASTTRKWLKANIPPNAPSRFLQVIRILKQNVQQKSKTIVFCHYPQTLDAMFRYLLELFGQERVAQFNRLASGGNAEKLQQEAVRFAEDARCLILLCDEMGQEGRNLQMATHILHLDLPWSPYEVEQRIGRVDRIGKQGEVVSQVVYAKGSTEEDLLRLWQEGLGIFERSISGLEMVIEEIYQQLQQALADNLNDGLKELVAHYQQMSNELEERLEEENYWSQELSKQGIGRYVEQDRERLNRQGVAGRAKLADALNVVSNVAISTLAVEAFVPSDVDHAELLECLLTVHPNVLYAHEHGVSALDFELISGFFREPTFELWVTLDGQLVSERHPLIQAVKQSKRCKRLEASRIDSRSEAWRQGIQAAYDSVVAEVQKHYRDLLKEVRPKAEYILRQQLHHRVAGAVYQRQSEDRTLIEQTLERNRTLLYILENPAINLAAATYWRVTPDAT